MDEDFKIAFETEDSRNKLEVAEHVGKMFESDDLSDVKIVVTDLTKKERRISAHKFILAG